MRTTTQLIIALVVTFGLAGCGTESTDVRRELSPEARSQQVPVVPCQELLDAEWAPPNDAEPDISYDPETGVAEVSFGADEVLAVDLVRDKVCELLPDIGGILARVTANYETIRNQECSQAVLDVANGVAPRKGPSGEVVGDLSALREHVLTWCPPVFTDRLNKLESSTQP